MDLVSVLRRRRANCLRVAVAVLSVSLSPSSAAWAGAFAGRVTAADGTPVAGAMVSVRYGDPIHEITVYSDERGAYRTPELPPGLASSLRVRRIGWKDTRQGDLRTPATGQERALALQLEPETDPASLAAQLPANRWYALLLERISDDGQREELVRQCTYCHQQGSAATRLQRDDEEWQKVLSLMARMGAVLSPDLRARIPELFRSAYDPKSAVPALTQRMSEADFAPPPVPKARRAVVEEWELGHRASMQHDLVVHPDGRIYSVDMTQDKLYRLDPDVVDGGRRSFDVPRGDLPLGGVFAGRNTPVPPNANMHVGPHSLQVAPDGAIWTTLAIGNQLARFDPERESWEVVALEDGYYPHTLRFDGRGRIWFTLAASNHVGVYDPKTREQQIVRLPARTFSQDVALRLLPFFLWLNRSFDLGDAVAAGEGMTMPVPYGIDVAPGGAIWFSQLNEHRIGRIDPDSLEVELVDTPFSAPRRLRFDSQGKLWIPGFSSSLVSRFDPKSRTFESFPIPSQPPSQPAGSDTPYALNVDRGRDVVWICGTNSDSLIRFDPAERAAGRGDGFTVYPLPTRVTYTREIDFDEAGRIWTSNSNLPTWQIEGGFPRVLRLSPGADEPEVALR